MEIGMRDGSLPVAGYETTLAGLRDLGLTHVELAISRENKVRSLTSADEIDLATAPGVARLKSEAQDAGVQICALLCAQDFNAEDRTAQVDYAVTAVRAAAAVGAGTVRVDSYMKGQLDMPLAESVGLFVQGLRDVLDATSDCSIALGVENHGPQGNDVNWMRAVMDSIGSDRVGLTLDVGNWYWYGYPVSRVYDIYREFGARTKHTHVKNINYPEDLRETQREIGYKYGEYCCPLDEGNLEMARVVSILRECGFDGVLVVEDESIGKYSTEERPGVLRRDVACLRTAIAS